MLNIYTSYDEATQTDPSREVWPLTTPGIHVAA